MKSSIKLILSVFILIVLTSCNQEPTLQKYFVENQELENFTSLDIPPSILGYNVSKLSKEELEAYNSIKKLNFLGYKLKEGNKAEYNQKLAAIKAILKQDKYQELMRAGNKEEGKILVKYLGTETKVDEVIFLGQVNNKGFAVARVLGKNMNPDKMLYLLEAFHKAKPNQEELKNIIELFQ